jgi:hypothetical protein
VLDGKFRLASHFRRHPHASVTCALTCNSRPGFRSASLAFGGFAVPELADLDDASPIPASSPRHRRAFTYVSTSCVRDRPCRTEAIGRPGHYGQIRITTGPIDPSWSRSSASLEVSPHPLQHTWVASRASSEGGRPPDVSRSGVHAAPSARAASHRDLSRRASALAVFRFFGAIDAASLDPADFRGGSFDRR